MCIQGHAGLFLLRERAFNLSIGKFEAVKAVSELGGMDQGLKLRNFVRRRSVKEPISGAVGEITPLVDGGVDL